MANELKKVVELNKSDWNNSVLNSEIPVLVDFWAQWCGPCRMVSPIVEQLAHSLEEKVRVFKVNVDQNYEIAGKYNVHSIPTLILFKKGNEVDRTIGVSSKEKYENFINTALVSP